MDDFVGFLKLKNDFTVEKLSIENVLLRNTVLRCTDWFFLKKIKIKISKGFWIGTIHREKM